MLLQGQLFADNKGYVRTQILHSLLQEDDAASLHAIACFLLLDGHRDDSTFPCMVEESCFPRLLELINGHRDDDDTRLHRLLLQLMYEMSRVERLPLEDLVLVDDEFIHFLFRIIEGVSYDVHDPYHYPTIRVLVCARPPAPPSDHALLTTPQLVLNEQYMLASTDPAAESLPATTPLTNRIVKCLSLHGPLVRTFGENIILLLNRETETSLQLLILKLLYLLFTTKATYEYFYTNDLRVLLDVIIRNLMDLPDERASLRHTYLRVLYPLLAHTQLSHPPHYKREEVLRVLRILRGSQNAHFAPADETTLRLVERVAKVSWLEEEEGTGNNDDGQQQSGQAEVARKFLGISLSPSQYASSISVGDVATVMEKPGVQTPSRNRTAAGGKEREDDDAAAATAAEDIVTPTRSKKPLPAVPAHRHGVPFVKTTPAEGSKSNGGGGKKVPPKAPPPRRWGKTKPVDKTTVEAIEEARE